MNWIVSAVLASLFAGLTSILAKCGIKKTDPDLATAIRSLVVLVFAWILVFITGSVSMIGDISPRSFVFLLLSGFASGASWICYFKALSMGDVNKVVPIDKSSIAMSVVLAILIFGETEYLAAKLIGTVLLTVGVLLMIERRESEQKEEKRGWRLMALLGAVFAALTSILGKIGIENVESNLATAVRTCVILLMAWIIVFSQGKHKMLAALDRRELVFISLSGLSTGASWLFYYYAIQKGLVSVVVPIDKMSILVSVFFSRLVFGEKLSRTAFIGLVMMLSGTLIMTVWA